MKPHRPSRTAHLVAFGRAMADRGVSHVPDFRDPTARFFLDEKARKSLARIEQEAREGKSGIRFEMTRRMADTMALRTNAIDAALRDAVAGGTTQAVILGAGYDGRAWRMPELAGVKVFEVDRPGTQDEKRARAADLPSSTAIVSFVPIDFEHESLGAILERAGHDPSVTTCWIWEGVIMYLTRASVRSMLSAIGGRSSPGSTLIVNYHVPHGGFIGKLIFRLIGEPQISAWTPAEMAAELLDAGFVVREDLGVTDWNERFAHGEARVHRNYYMRIAVADKVSRS